MFQPTNKETLILLEANLMLQQWPLLALLVPPEVVRKALVVLGGQRGQQYAKWSGSQRWSHDCRIQVQASDVGQLESCPSLCRFLKSLYISIYIQIYKSIVFIHIHQL